MTDTETSDTGYAHEWDAEAAKPSPEEAAVATGQAKLGAHIEQTWRNRHEMLANHPSLTETATRLAQAGKMDLTKGQAGIDAFCDEIAAELQKPEANGQTGMLADIAAWQTKNGWV